MYSEILIFVVGVDGSDGFRIIQIRNIRLIQYKIKNRLSHKNRGDLI